MSSKRQDNQVQPGRCPIDPETGLPDCPPPTEIDCVKVKKVFNECFQNRDVEIKIPFEAPTLEIITGDAQDAECVSAEATIIDCSVLENDRVRVTFRLEVTARVPLDEGGFEESSGTKIVSKLLFLSGVSEEGLDIECQVFPECLFCFISERDELGNVTEVTCFVSTCILLKSVLIVQLLIPTYGFCQPRQCSAITPGCPLFPPQCR
ncbi:MAG: hypothetical protein AB1420_04705 [Bacillota bacterium]